jgi:hypothetical protein
MLFAGAFVAYSWLGSVIVRPILRLFVHSRSETNSLVGNILSCHGVFYGLLLGLLAVAAYQNFSEAEAIVADEAASLSALYEDLRAYPEPEGSYLRWLLRDYCRYLIIYAWPLQRQGIVPEEGRPKLLAVQQRLLAYSPTTRTQEIIHTDTVHQFNNYLTCRAKRLHVVKSGLPAAMWYVVLLGSLVNLALVWLLDMKFVTQLFLGGILAFFLGTMLFLIAAMDNPFRGEISVSPQPIEALHGIMMEDSY